MDRYVCIHGHFYQPPRENPWLESIETQDSAAPFHDWNERITSECYATNAASRVLNHQKKITRIANNYARISHNFGPTLLSWLEENAQRAYRGILDADRLGMQRFHGHGPAMAQVYNHVIMPLANQRDRVTQIRWGIADFVHRYKRQPEGMWLAETAADRNTLDLLAQHNIKFVVLAPAQARHVRPIQQSSNTSAATNAAEWQPVTASTLDTRVAFRVPLEEGRSIAAFFYDGTISQAVAFEGLLTSGDKFCSRLLSGFEQQHAGPQLVHIATDGESYGHHHRHGEMALSYALQCVEKQGARLTVYGEFLELSPPRHEAEVHDNTAWSCFHGVERWRSDCGCSSNIAGWDQQWRGPLRNALDWLRDSAATLCEQRATEILKPQPSEHSSVEKSNPLWAARDAYIALILDRDPVAVDNFLATFLKDEANEQHQIELLQMMELQRHALLMFTSCGWFFDDITGIETMQLLTYAGRVLQLASALFGEDGVALEPQFLRQLGEARSNVITAGDAASLYRTKVRKQIVSLEKVAAHYAIRSMFEEAHPHHGPVRIFAYEVARKTHELHSSARARLLIGTAQVTSRLTREQQTHEYAVLHFGDQNLSAAVRPAISESGAEQDTAFAQFTKAAREAFLLGDLPGVVRLMDSALGVSTYSLNSLFIDEQRRILDQLLSRTLHDVDTGLRAIQAQHVSLMRFLENAGLPQPPVLRFVSEFVTTENLFQAIEQDPVQPQAVSALLKSIAAEKLAMDAEKLKFLATRRAKQALLNVQSTARMARAAARARMAGSASAEDAATAIDSAIALMHALRLLPVELNLWQAQNLWHQCWQDSKQPAPASLRAAAKNGTDDGWSAKLRELGVLMDLAVDEFTVEE